MEPTAEPLSLPAAYGRVTTTRPWSAVRERLEQAPRYWLVTTRSDGRAHVVPVDGLWLDDTWYYGGSPDTQHNRNLEQDPHAVIHLEDSMDVVIVEGFMEREKPSPDMARRMAASSKAKYGYPTNSETYAAGVWGLRPERARAWSSFPTDATRFVFS
jgi:hypothetical protein